MENPSSLDKNAARNALLVFGVTILVAGCAHYASQPGASERALEARALHPALDGWYLAGGYGYPAANSTQASFDPEAGVMRDGDTFCTVADTGFTPDMVRNRPVEIAVIAANAVDDACFGLFVTEINGDTIEATYTHSPTPRSPEPRPHLDLTGTVSPCLDEYKECYTVGFEPYSLPADEYQITVVVDGYEGRGFWFQETVPFSDDQAWSLAGAFGERYGNPIPPFASLDGIGSR